MRNFLKKLFHDLTGLRVYKKLPFGLDPLEDVGYYFPDKKFYLFFDVGANVGQSAKSIKKQFPSATVHCFEPVSTTFQKLKSNITFDGVCFHQIALGAENTTSVIHVDKDNSDLNTLVNNNESATNNHNQETIQIKTLNTFCQENNIEHIDYLKIDTEGFDLEVLKGAVDLLSKLNIDFIETEVSMNSGNQIHVDLSEIKKFLEGYKYRIYGIYEQMHEWPTKQPVLRRANVVFLSEKMYM